MKFSIFLSLEILRHKSILHNCHVKLFIYMLRCIDDVFSVNPASLTQRKENPVGIIIQLQWRVESTCQ